MCREGSRLDIGRQVKCTVRGAPCDNEPRPGQVRARWYRVRGESYLCPVESPPEEFPEGLHHASERGQHGSVGTAVRTAEDNLKCTPDHVEYVSTRNKHIVNIMVVPSG